LFQDAFAKISRNEGIKSLWSGLSPTLVLALPTTVLYFVAYEQIRVHLKDIHMQYTKVTDPEKYQMPMIIPLVAGCSARCFAVTVVNPLELIRTKMQSEKMSYSEVGKAFKKMVNQYGVRGLFKGLFPTIMRDAPFSSIYWTSYEAFKRFNEITQPNLLEAFIGGGLSGAIAAFITTPFDVIKTHQQIEFGEKFLYSANGQKKPMTTTLQTMRNILRTGGINGFFAGVTPRLFKVVSACAVMISTYEVGKTFFHGYNVQKYYEQHPDRTLSVTVTTGNLS
jgi:solute carrier family 25, member 39/40